MEYLAQHIESLIFTSEQPIAFKDIKVALEETFEAKLKEEDLQASLDTLMERYRLDSSSFEIVKIAGGYQFLTKGAYHNTVGTYLKQRVKKRLSRAALETLAIVAYKQPVTKGDIEGIRGVNCDYAMQKLLEKELVTIIGRSEAPGRPLLYGTSQKFMDYFGLHNLGELPKIKEFQEHENTIGEAAPIEEEIHAEHQGHRAENDDAVDIAIAVADLISPILPRDEAPVIEAEESSTEEMEEMTTEGAEGQADNMENTAEAAIEAEEVGAATIADEEEAEPEVVENTAQTEVVETTEEAAIAEFVTETSGEFTGEVEEETENETTDDNHSPGSDVVEEESSPIKED